MTYKVKEVAELVGISVRTLHYYDEINLLKPENVTDSGYRLYSDKDLEILQQILFFKELDFSLGDIKEILSNPSFNRHEALLAHHELLIKKRERLQRIIQNVENTLHAMKGVNKMDKKEMFEGFNMSEIEKYKEQYKDEVREKYDPDKVKECEEKTSSYTKEDWANIMNMGNSITKSIASKMDLKPSDPEIQKLIDDFRQYITRYFYECTPEILKGLGEMYVADPRFTAFYEKYNTGLAAYMKEATNYYYENQNK